MLRFASILLIAAFWSTFAFAEIPKFVSVTSQIYRGGRPDTAGLQQLAKMNVRTVINIDDNESAAKRERETAEKLGLRWINEPMDSFREPASAQIDRLLASLQDPSLFPVFIHCKHGEDRTGLVIGLYRVEVQKWTPTAAYKEMRERGFHPILKALDRFFHWRTASAN